ncbi:hypothetical protein CSOJ01_09245 [Colletotrichum sojae]|uniref:Uncharacterized protein n=1 Tax=Colletotrichum sojae TaxID=2175907 RepID=A0A8H6MRS3_9PEZI|nr:hypothetical protein CSOJ01_09245 [Colletotrichum sojae]
MSEWGSTAVAKRPMRVRWLVGPVHLRQRLFPIWGSASSPSVEAGGVLTEAYPAHLVGSETIVLADTESCKFT